MSYQVLARKWRPQSFKDVVGQESALKVLMHALTLGRVHHAYLFSGTRGVGKTSIARLLAKGLNCEKGITAVPCGECERCRDIACGRFVDLIEIDAASRTKVEDTREILDNVQYLPARGRFKVYLIDEVHMLSRSSFNALLKTLEEPPEHVKFLLATTDPQKLPITILSRCLHLHLATINPVQIAEQLERILRSEKIDYQNKAIQLLAKAAMGSMRDALSLTDQAIALGNGQIDATSVAVMLGTLDDAIPFALVEALINADGNALMAQLAQVAQQGSNFETVLADTISLLHQIALLQLIPVALGEYQHKEEQLRYFAQTLMPQDIQLYYQILLEGKASLAIVDDKKMAVEMIFLRALAFQPKIFQAQQRTRSLNSTQRALSSPESGVKSLPEKNKEDTVSVAGALTENDLSSLTQQILKAREKLNDSEPLKPKKHEAPSGRRGGKSTVKMALNVQSAPVTASKSDPESEHRWQAQTVIEKADPQLTPKQLRHSVEHEKTPELMEKLITETTQIDPWSAAIEQLGLMPIVKQLAVNAFLEEKEEGHWFLHLRSSQAHINKNIHCVTLQKGLSTLWGKELELSIVIDDDPVKSTPLELREMLYQKKLAEAKKALQTDEKVSLLCHYFDAQIDEESIRPV